MKARLHTGKPLSIPGAARRPLPTGGEGEEAAAKLQAQDAARGFYWIGDLVELLGQYENTRQEHPKLDDFMPDVLVFFDKFAKQGEPALATKSDSTVLASRAPGDTGVKGAPTEDTAAKPDNPEPGRWRRAGRRGARAQPEQDRGGRRRAWFPSSRNGRGMFPTSKPSSCGRSAMRTVVSVAFGPIFRSWRRRDFDSYAKV